jgi:hypothetical protein
MSKLPKCFVAYSSNLPGKGDSIETAVAELNKGGMVEVISWVSLAISGRPIIQTICDEIESSDLIIGDITNLNPNVLFELGFAITKRKHLWLIFNPKVVGAKVLFDRFQLLTTYGHVPYSNSNDIVQKFYSDQPHLDGRQCLYDKIIHSASVTTHLDSLLYIKPEESTEAVMRIARRVSGAPISSLVDDPKEIGIQPLEWYVANVSVARAVICQFLSDDYEDVKISNAKAAFVAGLAYGLKKRLLMLAQSPYQSPIDYRDLLRVHKDAKQAEGFYQALVSELLEEDKNKSERKTIHLKAVASHGGLLELNIGDPIAELEPEDLPEYFVPTSAYAEALNGQHSIFVGRKGAGKTATLLKVCDSLQADPRNHICIIKPIDYELEGLLTLLQKQMSISEKGFLVESFWKTLIYTELAKSVYEKLANKPEFIGRTEAEKSLITFVDANKEIILPEFSMRLETLVRQLSVVASKDNQDDFKNRISEGAHKYIISRLRDLLISALEKTQTVAVLVDNLDKSWTPRTNIQLVSELLFGLLSVSLRIADDFKKSSLGKHRLDVRMTLFIRSDIYAAIVLFAREPDKLPVRKIEWNHPEILIRVIERRIMVADPSLLDSQEIWSKHFVDRIGSIPTQEFLVASVFPRPRDLIYLVRASLQNAVNRGHTLISENDLLSGLAQYSSFAFASLMTEGSPQFRALPEFMFQLFGGPSILADDDIREALEEGGLGITNAEFVVDLLRDLTFLSYETAPSKFVFGYDGDEKPKLISLSKKTAKQVGIRRYQIHPAFHPYLELKETDAAGQMPISF